jgi:ribosomal protein S12 methylthiotransferase accessory factor
VAAGAEDASPAALVGLFGRAADYLSGPPGAPLADDVASLLRTLEYEPNCATSDVLANRVALLKAAAGFSRVFQLNAPDAPGLVFLGGEIDPGLAAPAHAQAARAGVGGMGLSLRSAFEACIGEGIEYLCQYESGDEPLLVKNAKEIVAAAQGEGRGYIESLLAKTGTAADAQLECLAATALSSDRTLLLPADVCLRRGPDRMRITPPFLLSTGCAAGRTRAHAVLHGLCELVERDAAGLWWRGGQRGRPLALEDPALREAAALLAGLRQGAKSRRTWLLDITTDLGIPAVAAISAHADGKGFACGLGARPTLAGAARGAIMELCQIELAHAVVAAKRAEGGEERLNARDRDHVTRATRIDADTCSLLHPLGMPVRREACVSDDTTAQIQWLAAHLAAADIEVFVLDLTRPRFGAPVARVVAPGLQMEPSQLQSTRLQKAIAATGGGQVLTDGISLF